MFNFDCYKSYCKDNSLSPCKFTSLMSFKNYCAMARTH